MSWFIAPESTRIDLPEGQWVEVKRRLNVGEQRELFRRVYPAATAGEKLKLDIAEVGFAKVLAYLLAWSLTDDQQKPVPISEGALNSLGPDKFAYIREAIEAHEDQQDRARDTEKNAPAGATA